jgi:hypothetical protein
MLERPGVGPRGLGENRPPKEFPMLKRRIFLAAGAAVPVVLVAGCGGSVDVGTRLRLVNASKAYGALDLWVENDRERSNVDYGSSSSYLNLDEGGGSYELAITRAGASAALIDESFSLSNGEPHTLLAYGIDGDLQAVLLVEDEDENDIDDNEALLCLFNAAPDAGELDLYLTAADVDLDDASADIVGASFGEASPFIAVDKGTWRLRLTATGDKDDVRLDLSGLVIAEEAILTFVASATASGVLVDGVLLRQDDDVSVLSNTLARVRVVSGIADSSGVDVSVNGNALVTGLPPLTSRPYTAVTAGSFDLVVEVDGGAVGVPDAGAEAGSDLTVLVYGTSAAPAVAVLADDNSRPTPVETRSKVRLVNAVAGLDGTLALSIGFESLVSGLVYGAASDAIELDADTDLTLQVISTRAGVLFEDTEMALDAGAVYTVFALGAAGDVAVQLVVDRAAPSSTTST